MEWRRDHGRRLRPQPVHNQRLETVVKQALGIEDSDRPLGIVEKANLERREWELLKRFIAELESALQEEA